MFAKVGADLALFLSIKLTFLFRIFFTVGPFFIEKPMVFTLAYCLLQPLSSDRRSLWERKPDTTYG
jgi:hypothetical protein